MYDFITDWLPRKCSVDSERRVKGYLASFKKYVQFMGEHNYMAAEAVADIVHTLKEDRQEMIETVVTYWDEPDEHESPEVFQARMQKLVERWKALPQESKRE